MPTTNSIELITTPMYFSCRSAFGRHPWLRTPARLARGSDAGEILLQICARQFATQPSKFLLRQ
jgi:hypothetical protein